MTSNPWWQGRRRRNKEGYVSYADYEALKSENAKLVKAGRRMQHFIFDFLCEERISCHSINQMLDAWDNANGGSK